MFWLTISDVVVDKRRSSVPISAMDALSTAH